MEPADRPRAGALRAAGISTRSRPACPATSRGRCSPRSCASLKRSASSPAIRRYPRDRHRISLHRPESSSCRRSNRSGPGRSIGSRRIPRLRSAIQRSSFWWLRHRIEATTLPERQIAIEFALPLDGSDRQWLLLAAGVEPELCQEDPLIGEDRYVFVEADAAALYPISRGIRVLDRCGRRSLGAPLRGSTPRCPAPGLVPACGAR